MVEERSREKTRQQAKSSRLKAGWRGEIDEGKLPRGDGTQLLAGAAVSSTCRAVMCAQPRPLPGHDRDSAGAMGIYRGVAKCHSFLRRAVWNSKDMARAGITECYQH